MAMVQLVRMEQRRPLTSAEMVAYGEGYVCW